jgi:hypothetical protein
MYELIERELYQALEYARNVDQDTGKQMLIQCEIDQPLLFQTIFKVFPSIIAEQNEDLANHFADLCFDVIAVFKKAFGTMPKFKDDPTWMERQAMLMDADLKPLIENKRVTKKASQQMKENFTKPKEGEIIQTGLVNFLNECVDDFASYNTCNPSSIELTKTMLFVVVRLFNSLYSHRFAQTIH